MIIDPVPITQFVTRQYETKAVQRIVESWRLDPKMVIDRVVEHFREMGFYVVTFHQEAILIAELHRHLRHSPDIIKLVQRARAEEARKVRHREVG